MSIPSSNPYESPSGFVPKPEWGKGEVPQMRYMEAFQYIFAHPDWVNNLLMVSVCCLIPVLGLYILLPGYQYEIVESMHRFPGQLYPKFDFSRFSQYLTRGIWPFLVNLIVGFVVQIPIQCGNFGLMALGAAAGQGGGDEAAGIIVGLGTLLFMLVVMVLAIAMTLVMMPILLRAGLSQDFAQSFKWSWIKDFLAKMWLETILAMLFLMVTSMIVVPLGFLACCVGILPAIVVMMLAHAHLSWQLYTIYLARGGEPIPLKNWDGPAPMAPVGM